MKIALWQTTPHHDPQEALHALDAAAGRARAMGADLIVTPEMALGGYNIGRDATQALADRADRVIAGLQRTARAHGIAVVAGLALPGSGRPMNAALALDATGQERQRYHKTHLYSDVDHSQFDAGAALSEVFDLGGWRVAMAICYDIEFPELARALALKGADLILVPTANMHPYESVNTRLVPTRAEENAVYLAYANYVGSEAAFDYAGLSCICGPDGADLARASGDAPDLIVATLDHAALAACRARQTHRTDRRPDLYKPLLD